MHQWGDKWFKKYGDELDDAVVELSAFCKRWGRFGGQAKEKFGTLRFYAVFHCSLFDLLWPGYCWVTALWRPFYGLDLRLTQTVLYQKTLGCVIRYWQHFIYRTGYKRILSDHPHLRKEILCCSDYPELLKGL